MAIDTVAMRLKMERLVVLHSDIRDLCDEIDRLRAEAKATPQQQGGKTVKVRVAVVVSKDGEWQSYAFKGDDNEPYDFLMEPGEAIYWLTATLPVPEEMEIVAEVEHG